MSVKNVVAITFMCQIIKVFHLNFLKNINLPRLFNLSGILPEPRYYYRIKLPCLFCLSGILPESRNQISVTYVKNEKQKQNKNKTKQIVKHPTMSFLAEVIPPGCWIILYLQYHRSFFSTINKGRPELPCMTVVTIVIIIVIIIIIIIIITTTSNIITIINQTI